MDLKQDLIGLAIIALVVLCGWFGLSRITKPYDISNEEYERRAKEGPGLLGASLVGLQKALDPSMQKSVEVQEDLRQGRYDDEQGSGEPPEAGSASGEQQSGLTANEEETPKGTELNA